jgi:hypothetical protein
VTRQIEFDVRQDMVSTAIARIQELRMRPFYARLHELSRQQKWAEYVDVFVKTREGKDCLWATIHIDFFSDCNDTVKKRLESGETVELWITETKSERL